MESSGLEVLKIVNLSKLNFKFERKPVLVSGMALMYYGLRNSTKDIDLIISQEDHKRLVLELASSATVLEGDCESGYKEKPEYVDLYQDHGILFHEFEIWDSIYQFNYEVVAMNAIEEKDFLVISLENMLLMSFVRGLREARYMEDAKLIGQEIEKRLYKNVVPNKNAYFIELLKKQRENLIICR